MSLFPRAAPGPPLVDTLRLLFPPADATDLLRACVGSGPALEEVWARCLRAVPNPLSAAAGRRLHRLFPLLGDNLRRQGIIPGGAWSTCLRVAGWHEELRSRGYRDLLADALRTLDRARVEALLLGGGALAEIVYARPGLRHCDTIDLFVRPGDLERAARVLASSGFALRTPPPRGTPPAYRLLHDASGLPLTIGAPLFGPLASMPAQEVWSRARPLPTLGVPAAVPSPADLLIHVLARAAMERSRDTLVWASDAVLTLRASPSLDWTVAIDAARRSGLALPVWVLLEWLATALEAPVPAPALDTLRAEARTADSLARQLAVAGVRSGRSGSVSNLLRASGWRSRLTVLRWALAPSPASLRSTTGVSGWAIPVLYLSRPLRALGRAARRAFRRRSLRKVLKVPISRCISMK